MRPGWLKGSLGLELERLHRLPITADEEALGESRLKFQDDGYANAKFLLGSMFHLQIIYEKNFGDK